MNRLETVCTVVALVVLLAFSGSGFAAKGGKPGPPTDGGGGGSPDLGDIIVLYRDAWGIPILNKGCQQPLAAPGLTLPPVGDEWEECIPLSETQSCIIPVNTDTCAVVVGYEMYTQEVDFGRTSVIRSPLSVIEQSLGEVVTKLATAQCTTLDPAGRLVNTSEIDDDVVSATIDSPLENLAIYRQLMLTGYLGAEANPLVLPDLNVLNMAARGYGAADDKTGKVTVDQVVYTNEIMGLTDVDVSTYLPKICMDVREEVQGAVLTVTKCFLNYGPQHPTHENVVGSSDYRNYEYYRDVNFGALPAPPYIDEYDSDGFILQEDVPGWFEYLGTLGGGLFIIVQDDIFSTVFGSDPGFLDGNIGGFTQAADDTREVILFMHDRPLPVDSETPVPMCDVPDTDQIYDLSISEESGLQVPKRMVAGAEEGREIIVTVANKGPDVAMGIVTLIGKAADQTEVFNDSKNFTIEADGTYSSNSEDPWLFSLSYATTVSWTATATPDCVLCDMNMGNNTVTATTKVMTTGGGGGGGGGRSKR